MSAVAAPNVELNVTENAAVEIKKFLAGEEDLPETAGLRRPARGSPMRLRR